MHCQRFPLITGRLCQFPSWPVWKRFCHSQGSWALAHVNNTHSLSISLSLYIFTQGSLQSLRYLFGLHWLKATAKHLNFCQVGRAWRNKLGHGGILLFWKAFTVHQRTHSRPAFCSILTLFSISVTREITEPQITWLQEGSSKKSMFIKAVCSVSFNTLEIRLQLSICITHHNSTTQVLLQFPSSRMAFTPSQVKFLYLIIFLNIIKEKKWREE